MKKKLKELAGKVKVVLICAAIAAVVIGVLYLDMTAYKQRFPDASTWTYFFSGNR
jgi:hypothetical protein